MDIADVVLDGKSYEDIPFFSFGYSIVSPLHWGYEACEIFLRTSGRKIPVTINSEPLAGGTSPVTLAGSLALANAEVLSGIVINQLIEPGRPILYNIGFAHLLDMYTAVALTGAPENGLLAAAGAELGAFYKLPSASWFGTDSMTVDGQASFEKMLTIFTHSTGGANFIWGAGNTEATKCFSCVMAVLDNEMIGAVERYKRGIEFNDETLAMDAIYEIGFSGGFLSSDHTLEHFKSENRYETAVCRMTRNKWQASGSMTMEDNAKKTVSDILSSPYEQCIDGSQLEKILVIEKRWVDKLSRL